MVLAIANKKGGVSKTTTALIFSSLLAKRERKVLLVDIDPQGNASTASGGIVGAMGTYELLEGQEAPQDTIQTAETGYDFIAADTMLNKRINNLPDAGRDKLLDISLRPLRDKYDFIIIDTPPDMGTFTINALVAADEVLIPMRANRFSVDGMTELWANIIQIRRIYDKPLQVNGILLNCADERTRIYKQLFPSLQEMAEKMETKVYKSFIRRDIKVEEAQLIQKDITEYNPDSRILEDYSAVVDEFLGGQNG